METVTRNSSRKSNKKIKPVVDVPRGEGTGYQITEFMEKNKSAVKAYMEDIFEGVGKKEINEVLRECAECSVLTRSPKEGGCWEDDTQIIEDALKCCDEIVVAPQAIDDEDEVEEEPVKEEPIKAQDDQPQKKKVNKAKKKTKSVHKASPRKKSVKVAAKKTKKKTVAKKVTTKPQTKKKTVTKKAKAKPSTTAVPTNSKFSHILNTNTFSEENLKGLKGLELWVGAARLLKKKSKIRCQLQDMEEVVTHLFAVHRGKAKLKEEGFEGRGEKSYRKRRLVNILEAIKKQLGEK